MQDNHCKIIQNDDATRRTALNALINVNIDKAVAERLLTENFLQVVKFQSGKPLMDNCAVVKCGERIMWNIPRIILEGTIKK